MPAQRAVHRLMSIAQEKLQHLGFVYRVDRVTRTGRVLDSEYVDYAHDVCWC
jgi:hypothetical protein